MDYVIVLCNSICARSFLSFSEHVSVKVLCPVL